MSDVIDRLTDARDRDAVSDAQEEIIALRAEKGRLTAENERLRALLKAVNIETKADIATLTARVKELEEALEAWACTGPECKSGCRREIDDRDDCCDARAALEEKQ